MMIVRLRREERMLLASLLLLALAQSLTVMIPAWAVQHIFDGLSPSRAKSSYPMELLVGAFLGGATIAFLAEIAKRRLATEISLRHAAHVRQALFVRQISSNPYRPKNKGTVLLPFVGDLTAIRRWVSEGLARGGSALILMPVMLTIIATRSFPLAGALALVLLLSFACSALLIPPLDRAVREVRKRRGALVTFIGGRIEAAATIRASGRAGSEARKVETRTRKLSDAERSRAWVLGTTRGVALLTHSLLVLAALTVGVAEAGNGTTTPGAIAAVLSLVGLLGTGVVDLTRALELRQPAKVAQERIERILASSPSRRTSLPGKAKAEPGLLLSDFAIADLLDQVSVTAGEGARISIEGPTGVGKSTLINAIAQGSPDHTGHVLLDGADLRRMRSRRRAELIGLASADLPLLPGSLGMNLRYRAPGISDEDLLTLAMSCGLASLVERVGGLEGRLAGPGISAGERQALAIARAVAGRPRLLLLDAVDSQLDADAYRWLRQQVATYDGIVLFIASRAELRAVASGHWLLSGRRLEAQPADKSNIIRFGEPRT
jgi:ABC-type multidrug transport system fused ATPase/permease subunit